MLKRTVDLAASATGLLVTALLWLPIALAIRLDGRGPVLYRQVRLGQFGRLFTIVEFRTMRVDAEADGTPRWAGARDPRVTRVGRFLRATRLDALPQCWNVLRGPMSCVGPRPERPAFVATLEQQLPFSRARLLAKPGLTGWA